MAIPEITFQSSIENSAHEMPVILTVNGGSSSIKFAAFSSNGPPKRLFSGQAERIGTLHARLALAREDSSKPEIRPVAGGTFDACVQGILDYLRLRIGRSDVAGIGHRIVHGGLRLLDHQLITPDVIVALRAAQPLDLDHLPREIALIEQFGQAFPGTPQIGCFDTAFHREMPHVAQLLAIPRRHLNAGIRRFGFHGLSYTYLMDQLAALAGPEANGRVILAHLGSGASMAAVRGGKPIDTTMAFTPTSGLVMGTRPGDLDPGLMLYLMKEQQLSTAEMEKFISQECGLLGVSEISSDVRDLLAIRAGDSRAADAIALFCYQAKKHLGALTAALGGVDTIVFAGGIGENAPEVRAEICGGLEFPEVRLDASRNIEGHGIISTDSSAVTVRIIPTDEEMVIARIVTAQL